MKKKGFTLIELLAVIVVLAIIALITVPTVLGIIDKAKKGAIEDAAYGVVDAVKTSIATNMLMDINYKIPSVWTDINLDVDGKKPTSIAININEDGTIGSGTIAFDDFVVTLDENGKVNHDIKVSTESVTSDVIVDEYSKKGDTSALANWSYDVDNTLKRVYLKQYTGSETEITINGQYLVGTEYYDTYIVNPTSTLGVDSRLINYNPTLLSLSDRMGSLSGATIADETNVNGLFAQNTTVTKITFNSLVNTSDLTDMSNMFYGCTKLTEIIGLEYFDTSSVTDMSNLFNSCIVLENVDLSKLNTANVINMSGMFDGCTKIKKIDVSSFNTSNVINMSKMFAGSFNFITSLDLSNFNTSKVADMSNMFAGNYNLTTIYASSLWNTINVTLSTDMFANDTVLVGGISYDSTKTDVNYANFDGYLTLKEVSIPNESI